MTSSSSVSEKTFPEWWPACKLHLAHCVHKTPPWQTHFILLSHVTLIWTQTKNFSWNENSKKKQFGDKSAQADFLSNRERKPLKSSISSFKIVPCLFHFTVLWEESQAHEGKWLYKPACSTSSSISKLKYSFSQKDTKRNWKEAEERLKWLNKEKWGQKILM